MAISCSGPLLAHEEMSVLDELVSSTSSEVGRSVLDFGSPADLTAAQGALPLHNPGSVT